jgi:hypothetical protein
MAAGMASTDGPTIKRERGHGVLTALVAPHPLLTVHGLHRESWEGLRGAPDQAQVQSTAISGASPYAMTCIARTVVAAAMDAIMLVLRVIVCGSSGRLNETPSTLSDLQGGGREQTA